MVRKKYLETSLGDYAMDQPPPAESEHITRASLEEDARQDSLKTTGAQDRFWHRQRSWEESAKVGAGLIEEMAPVESKKSQ